jgi:DNA-binding CsgD family transcriptional regulator
MSVRYRPMRRKDIGPSVDIIAADRVVAPRYGHLISQLRSAWLRLLDREALRSVVLEDVDGPRVTLLGAGVSAFVSDDFVRELKTSYFWIGPEVTRRFSRGRCPLLSDDEVREANSKGGLNLMVWHGCFPEEQNKRLEVQNAVGVSFLEQHRGYRLKEYLAQADSVVAWQFLVNTGSVSVLRAGNGGLESAGPAQDLIREPHVFSAPREHVLSRFGSFFSSLFLHQAPQIGFRPSEQRLLLSALRGGTDEELADGLRISLSAVKKTWRSIYDRVSERLPDMIPGNSSDGDSGIERGKEKKQRLLTYVREHPEELRPVVRQTPQSVAKSRRASSSPSPR